MAVEENEVWEMAEQENITRTLLVCGNCFNG